MDETKSDTDRANSNRSKVRSRFLRRTMLDMMYKLPIPLKKAMTFTMITWSINILLVCIIPKIQATNGCNWEEERSSGGCVHSPISVSVALLAI